VNPKRILVADDEPHLSRVIELFLRREGYVVDVVRDGREALDYILRRPPDALVTDINMPRMTGKELCLELEQQLPQRQFKIIVLSSMTDRDHRDWSNRMRNTVFMEKPVSMRSLVSMLTADFANDRAEERSSDA
jgi:DNA-binding response OmpR family regulator